MTEKRAPWKTLSVTAVAALAVSALLTFSRPVELRVDGQRLASEVPPVTQNHDVFVPLRAISDALGADTRFDADHEHIEVIRGDQTLRIAVGSVRATLNGAPMTFRHAPFRVRGRVMMGLRAISRAFGVKAHYDRRTSRIDVDSPGVIEAGAQADTDTAAVP
ncbi:MAG: hypothetical protein NVS1B14_02990 [Vulcanimicrobiaceae bacterium]